ncbi:MAG: aspartate kinase [Nitrososphaerota archaeon]|nr:aspartate kinase [Nitrososphaerota archaeon]MDG6978110.1 aspartate kinase [Nitrososphaerota archaeon]MDG7020330.1 aspartate kinase [Nitrososphaerota archaeon]
MRIVMKFGGTSVASAERIKNVAERVKGSGRGHQVVVVCSAMGDVTDELLALCADASKGMEKPVEERLASVRETHLAALAAAVGDKEVRRKVQGMLNLTLSQLEKLARGSTVLGELTPRSRDAILSCGERLSNPIVMGALIEKGVDAVFLTGGEAGIMTDDRFGDATPLLEVTKFQVSEKLSPLLAEGKTPVVTGYIGATQSGDTTTLGRGGSDFTGTLIASAVDADEVWIWSDVDGLMTADPRLVPSARVLREISYEEAGEMAVFGAKALHPRTLEPVAEKGIPVRFRNTFKPDDPGTVVKRNPKLYSKSVVKGVALVKEVAVITVRGASMVGKPGSAARIFDVMGRSGINVLMISQSVSESNISLVVARSAMEKGANALELALLGDGGYRHILTEGDVSAVAVVGGAMRSTKGVAATAFGAISAKGINIKMIASGSSNQNLSLIVAEKDAKDTVRAIHSAFRLDRLNS